MRGWTLSAAGMALALMLASPAQAAFAPTFGSSWDAPGNSLQNIVDAVYGPGVINVATDYIGHDASDLDPWFWVDTQFSTLIVREIAGNANQNVVGWYSEVGALPVIDGVGDGIVFNGPQGPGSTAFIALGKTLKFGFYMNPNGTIGATNAPEPEKFYTNRQWNDLGANGSGATHSPFNGDCQALVFDISNIVNEPNTFLVAFEDLDSGAPISPCCTSTDNDYNDFVMEVQAFGATPAAHMTFGKLKQIYLK